MTKRTKKGNSNRAKKAITDGRPTTTDSIPAQHVPAQTHDVSKGFWKSHWWQCLVLFVLPFVLYYQSTGYGYVLDDQIVITDNSFTKQGWAGIDDLLLTESFTGYFGEQKDLVQGNRYRPLSLVTFAVEYGIQRKLSPWLSHFINILLYAFIGLLIYRLMHHLLPGDYLLWPWLTLPFAIAVLYISHPIHSEAVANIKGRDELMAMLLSLSTLYYMLRHRATDRLVHLVAASGMFLLALLSKENSITFLAVIPLTIYFFSDTKWWTAVWSVWPLVAVFALYLGLRIYAAGVPDLDQEITDLMNNPFLGMSVGEKLATISFTLLRYLQLYLWPHPLSHDYYPYAIPRLGWLSWQALLSLAVYIGLIVWAIRGWRTKQLSSYAIGFYLVTLSIVSNVVVNLGTFMNERFLFMASLGLTLLFAHILFHKASRLGPYGKYLATALLTLTLLGYTYKTIDRVPDWESALTLNRSAVEGGSNSARANSFMATALYNEAKTMTSSDQKTQILADAQTFAAKAITIHPKYSNANLMLAGISAELYKSHRDQAKLLADFEMVAHRRPDVSYLTEYLDYLEGSTSNLEQIVKWYQKVGAHILTDNTIHNSWAVHYLLRAYKHNRTNRAVLQGLVQGYQSLNDGANAQRFSNELNAI